MIVKIAPALLREMARPGHQIHVECISGISGDYTLEWIRLDDQGAIEMGWKHANDDKVNTAPFVPTFRTIEPAAEIESMRADLERVKLIATGMFLAGGNFDDKTVQEIIALGFRCLNY
jgi:hypothetical protein